MTPFLSYFQFSKNVFTNDYHLLSNITLWSIFYNSVIVTWNYVAPLYPLYFGEKL